MCNVLKAFLLFSIVIMLTGCIQSDEYEKKIAPTPQQALERMDENEENHINVTQIYQVIPVHDDRVYIIYKGMIDRVWDTYVAQIEKKQEGWAVTETTAFEPRKLKQEV